MSAALRRARVTGGSGRSRIATVVGALALFVPMLTMNMPQLADAASSTMPAVVDYSQCANDAPPSTSTACPGGWINGILQSSNSHYHENDATPQRTIVAVPSAGSGASLTHTLTYTYETRKDSAPAHAYDSLTTWNLTQTTADRCGGLKSGVCPGGAASTKPIPADNTSVGPAGAGISTVTAAHSIPGVMTMYGGTITAVSTPTHSNPVQGTGDDYATITVSYTVPSSKATQNVELLFGGHLASSSTSGTGWGAGLGAANISGGPYHIKFTAMDGGSAGSRDNQIQASAILPLPPAFSITKVASPTVTTPGGTVTYTLTVTNNGLGSGTATVNDVYDSRVTIVLPLPSGCTNNASTHTITCTTGPLAAGGGSQQFQYQATMPTQFTGSSGGGGCQPGQYPVVNTATVTGGASQSATVCVTASPSFTIKKTANPTSTTPGGSVTYTLLVTNTGSASGAATATDVYDSRITITSVGAGCTNDAPNHTITCTTNVLPGGGGASSQQSFTYTATMPTQFAAGDATGSCASGSFAVINNVTVTGGAKDSAQVCVSAAPKFTLVKSADTTSTTPGATVTYTLTVTNTGNLPGIATVKDVYDSAVTIQTPLPTGCTNDAANHTLTCTTGTLPGGGGATSKQSFVYKATMPSQFTGTSGGGNCPTGSYPVINNATVTGGDSKSVTVCVNAAPKFVISKSADPTTVAAGGTVTYTLTVTNNGNASGSDTVHDVYDSRVTIQTPLPTGCTNDAANHTLTCTTGTLPGGGGATSKQSFVYKATMPSQFTTGDGTGTCPPGSFPVINTATLVSGDHTSNTECVTAAPKFTVTKSASPTSVAAGGTVTYTLTVTNIGSASGVGTATDVYDSRVTIQTPLPTGCTNDVANHTLTCVTGTLPGGGGASSVQTFVYKATMPALFTGTDGTGGCPPGSFPVINTVTVTPGPDSKSNTECVTAAPSFTIKKTASPLTANPGDTVTYTLKVTNTGTASGVATVTDVYDSRVTITSVPAGCSNDAAHHTLTCTTGTLAGGSGATSSQSFVYTATMPTSFTTGAGTGGCGTGSFPVTNNVTVTGGGTDSATVCVTAPILTIAKVSTCTPQTAVPGGFFSYTITVGNSGAGTAKSVSLVDTLPANTTVANAGGGTVNAAAGTVTWALGDLASNASVSKVLVVRIAPVANGTTLTNTATASGTGAGTATASFPVTVIDVISGTSKAAASGRAYGVQANLLDLLQIPATPDTSVKNPDSLLSLDSPPPVAGVLHLGLMEVNNSKSVSSAGATDTAIDTTAAVNLAVPGGAGSPIQISASTLVARSESDASALSAGSSFAGSTVQNLVINGTQYGNINTPTTIDVYDPILHTLEGHVYVLENTGTGAAKPVTEPEGTAPNQTFNSGMSVNALHVSLLVGTVHTDVVVAHADSTATFPAGLGCQPFPSLRGDAYNVDTPNLNPPLAEVKNGLVTLPSTGGTVDSSIADLSPLGVGAGTTHTDGTIGLLPTTGSVHSSATLSNVNLLSGAITATTVQSTSNTSGTTASSSSSGTTTIAHLVIGGTDICAALGLSAICTPPPNDVLLLDNNTVIVLLNEQLPGGNSSELRVNAVHIFVIGQGNPLGLPVGAEVVLSSSFSGDRIS